MLGFAAAIGIMFLGSISSIVANSIAGFNSVLEGNLIPGGFPEAGGVEGQSIWTN